MSRVSFGDGFAYIVSDSMGGHKGGAEAAEMTVRTFEQHLSAQKDSALVEKTIQEAFAAANSSVYEAGHSGDPETAGMGATAVICVTQHASALVAHVGDSRAYLHRGEHLRRLTTDHTRAQRLVAAGVLSATEAENHPDASTLSRAIGQLETVECELGSWIRLKPGDQILLCSDGLFGEADDVEILQVLRRDASPQRLADRLVALALRKGGHDNVTVQVIRYGTRPVPFNWKPLTYHVATLPVLALGFAATIHRLDSRIDTFDSQQIIRTDAGVRALQAGAAESRDASNIRLAALDRQIAALTAAVVNLTAATQAAGPTVPAGTGKKHHPSAGRGAATATEKATVAPIGATVPPAPAGNDEHTQDRRDESTHLFKGRT